tara:strand:- start:8775 stop:9035 length:261 start_codon:yes stop_codon:yes gene_type:complete
LKLFSGGNSIGTKDDWQSSTNSSEIGNLLPPSDNKESAILVSLDLGSYTVVLFGGGGATGIELIELFKVTQLFRNHLKNFLKKAAY